MAGNKSFIFSENLAKFLRNLSFFVEICHFSPILGQNELFLAEIRPKSAKIRTFPADPGPSVANPGSSGHLGRGIKVFIYTRRHSRVFYHWGLGNIKNLSERTK